MGTTSAAVAATVLDVFTTVGVQFAVLHREAEIAGGSCSSDIDVVMGDTASEAVRSAAPLLRECGLHVVTMWEYDNASTSVFVLDHDGLDGAQIDILHDHRGLGRYGVRAQVVVDAAVQGERWRTASPAHELLYLLRKRARKRQIDRLGEIRAPAKEVQRRTLEREAHRMFTPRTARLVIEIIDGSERDGRRIGTLARTVTEARRLTRRTIRPNGFWLALSGAGADSAAAAVADRFAPVLPLVRLKAVGEGTMSWAAVSATAEMTRRQAGLYCTWTTATHRGWPDLRVDASRQDVKAIGRAVVRAMETNVGL